METYDGIKSVTQQKYTELDTGKGNDLYLENKRYEHEWTFPYF